VQFVSHGVYPEVLKGKHCREDSKKHCNELFRMLAEQQQSWIQGGPLLTDHLRP
jgi:hypothetical protein